MHGNRATGRRGGSRVVLAAAGLAAGLLTIISLRGAFLNLHYGEDEPDDLPAVPAEEEWVIPAAIQPRGEPCPPVPERSPALETAASLRPVPGPGLCFAWTPQAIDLRIGNMLAVYWNARAVSQFTGAAFERSGEDVGVWNNSWLRFLARRVPARCPNAELYEAGFQGCNGTAARDFLRAMFYPATCNGHWSHFRSQIQAETEEGMKDWSKKVGIPLQRYNKTDVVVQFRCSFETLLGHPDYGPLGYSCYNVIPKDTRYIRVVADKEAAAQAPACITVLHALKQHLKWLRPRARVIVRGRTADEDFMALWAAPTMLRDGQSSFGLFAGFGGTGVVYSQPFIEGQARERTPDWGPDWRWNDCPTLYPSVAQKLKITEADQIIKWQKRN
ncbi:MAG: hypothetical protein J3K34DRAFT_83737 [Monoraphidium minutum]|nr:MAG: hypothetical protein J3K34DRAFT_83737 [Monoraphidium minutum]